MKSNQGTAKNKKKKKQRQGGWLPIIIIAVVIVIATLFLTVLFVKDFNTIGDLFDFLFKPKTQ
jgi:flagellar basal body-associated protein FliL